MGWNAPGIANRRSFLQAAHHVNLAHGEAVRTLRTLAPGASLGAIYNRQLCVPISAKPEDAVAANLLDACWNRLYADPQILADYPPELVDGVQEFVAAGDMARIAQPIDWYGLNHYCPIYARADQGSLGFAWADAPHDVPLTGVGWRIDPDAFRNELTLAYRRYKLPIYVTENGYGANETLDEAGGVNDGGRISYLAAYTKAVEEAVASGADVRGYFAWSILDNFEWGSGYASRFGLVYVDYATQRRVPKASFDWFAALIRAQQK
jgi:beta-glucosidase